MTTTHISSTDQTKEANASFLARSHRLLGYRELRGSDDAIASAPATVSVHPRGSIATPCSIDSRDHDDVGRARIGRNDHRPRLRNRFGAPVQS